MDFLEIEHKFLVHDVFGEAFDDSIFLNKIIALSPNGRSDVQVCDTYFIRADDTSGVYRHRFDSEIQQLTYKSLIPGNNEIRKEINLDLGHHSGNQVDIARAFLKSISQIEEAKLEKHVQAFYFPHAEVVYYEASNGKKKIKCIEVEAIDCQSIQEAKETLAYFESQLGLDAKRRCFDSLFELLVLEILPVDMQAKFKDLRSS